jgi:predicted DNA-binding WGR domain protein
MPRYEFSDGKSNKFWEIELDGTSFTTTYGRIGTNGQTSMKEYDSTDKAKKEYDKLVAEKVKKGYKLVAAGAANKTDEEGEEGEEEEDEE